MNFSNFFNINYSVKSFILPYYFYKSSRVSTVFSSFFLCYSFNLFICCRSFYLIYLSWSNYYWNLYLPDSYGQFTVSKSLSYFIVLGRHTLHACCCCFVKFIFLNIFNLHSPIPFYMVLLRLTFLIPIDIIEICFVWSLILYNSLCLSP